MRTKIFIAIFVAAILLSLVAIASYAIHIEGTSKAEKQREMQEETALINEDLAKDNAEGKMAGQGDMGNQFVNSTQGLDQQIGDNLSAQAELENKGSGDWIDPAKKE